jgi:hypothetical protein
MSTSATVFARISSILGEPDGATSSNPFVPAERRSKCRYPLDLGVRFRPCFEKAPFSSSGRTINLSSGGILVASQHLVSQCEISVGTRIEMSIEWPVLLDGRIPLQFVAVGRVVRRGPFVFAVAFERHQFRTVKTATQSTPRLGGDAVEWPASKVTVPD